MRATRDAGSKGTLVPQQEVNRLCAKCSRNCKQRATVVVVGCAKYARAAAKEGEESKR